MTRKRTLPERNPPRTVLVAIILIVGGLTFLPSLALGPIADQFAVSVGTLF